MTALVGATKLVLFNSLKILCGAEVSGRLFQPKTVAVCLLKHLAHISSLFCIKFVQSKGTNLLKSPSKPSSEAWLSSQWPLANRPLNHHCRPNNLCRGGNFRCAQFLQWIGHFEECPTYSDVAISGVHKDGHLGVYDLYTEVTSSMETAYLCIKLLFWGQRWQ